MGETTIPNYSYPRWRDEFCGYFIPPAEEVKGLVRGPLEAENEQAFFTQLP
jgi:hypothetical protein